MNRHSSQLEQWDITLSLPKELSDAQWRTIGAIYRGMDGWMEGEDYPSWYGPVDSARFISVSFEPAGLQVFGTIERQFWTGWLTVLCARLSLALNFSACDAAM
jgi:hypothetical protein